MGKLNRRFTFGDIKQGDTDEVIRALMDMYEMLVDAINRKPDIIVQDRSPMSSDYRFPTDSLWFYPNVPELWILESVAETTATWTQIV